MVALAACLLLAPRMVDVTDAVGLGPEVIPETVPRVLFADLNDDGWPDLLVNRHRAFLNVAHAGSPIGRRFREVPSGLTPPLPGTTLAVLDLDNDGRLDAVVAENCQPDDSKWQDHGRRTRWYRGNGDGTFRSAEPLPVPPRPTIAVAAGELNRDGRLDLFFAHSYKAGDTYEAFPADLLTSAGRCGWNRTTLPDERIPFNDHTDPGSRPTYGAMFVSLDGKSPMIYQLSYGRRWNRLWVYGRDHLLHEPSRVQSPSAGGFFGNGPDGWVDLASRYRLDGDFVRHGVYPAWLIELAKTRPQFPTKPEKPFRANGNSFDASVGDVDNDGKFDLLTTEITHAWAGESSDRSRILFQGQNLRFAPRKGFEFDRSDGTRSWNQGDLFGELVDMDSDGWLDLVLSSGDYPDQQLRVYLQRNGRLIEAKDALPIKHDGSQQISFGDVDGDGAPDLAVGQTFNRLNAEQIAGRKPKMRLFVNRMAVGNHRMTLRLKGDGRTVNRNALGAVVKAQLLDGRRLQSQLVGIGGHAGKQHEFVVRFGLGKASRVTRLEISWPGSPRRTVYRNLPSGTHTISLGEKAGRRVRLPAPAGARHRQRGLGGPAVGLAAALPPRT
ncbi:MAG TPA: CRTAC1 family protein [Fimbriimonas sp.]